MSVCVPFKENEFDLFKAGSEAAALMKDAFICISVCMLRDGVGGHVWGWATDFSSLIS